MVPTFTHLWLFVEDMARARTFYEGTVVVSDFGEFVELNANEHVMLSLYTRSAMTTSEPALATTPVGGHRSTIVLQVEAIDAYCATLRDKGVVFLIDETDHPEWGLRTAFLADPDGNLLCLYSGLAE